MKKYAKANADRRGSRGQMECEARLSTLDGASPFRFCPPLIPSPLWAPVSSHEMAPVDGPKGYAPPARRPVCFVSFVSTSDPNNTPASTYIQPRRFNSRLFQLESPEKNQNSSEVKDTTASSSPYHLNIPSSSQTMVLAKPSEPSPRHIFFANLRMGIRSPKWGGWSDKQNGSGPFAEF